VEIVINRQTLADDAAPDFFDPEVNVLVAPIIINVINQVSEWFHCFTFCYFSLISHLLFSFKVERECLVLVAVLFFSHFYF